MGMVESGSDKQSVWAKIGSNFVKFIIYTAKPSNWAEIGTRGEKFVGRSLALPLNAAIYPMRPSSWSKSWSERGSDCTNGLTHLVSNQGDDSFFDRSGISLVKSLTYLVKPSNLSKPSLGWVWHDIKNGGRYIIGMPLEEYTQFAKDVQEGITQASKNLAVKVKLVDYKKGKMIFEASRVLGDASRLTSEQLDKIKKGLPNVTVDKGRNEVTIEVDVDAIINDIKADPENKGKSEKEIRKLATARIEQEVDSSLKKFGEISGGEFKYHTDKKLLRAIGETLYRGSVSKEKPVEKPAESVTRLNEKPLQDLDPSKTETLRSGDKQELSEALRRLCDDGSLPKIAEPLVNNSEKSARGDFQWGSDIINERKETCATGKVRQ
ncbi:hypothetical protein [Wolbachia endosymbiont (group E) of Neria commutata]|uniref:hypothetical protein n=1 Tax=Wolbachia endosymbiont (group E) of Neria commutata TaxID=3066149 RepID=UPI003132F387